MFIFGEPCNVDAHAKIPALFMTILCPRLCVSTVQTYCTVVLLTNQSIASIQGHHTPHNTQTKSNVELGFPN